MRVRKFIAGGVAAALLSSSATPAFAGRGGPYVSGGVGWNSGWSGNGWGGGGGRGWGRHHDHVDAGDVIAGLAIFGVIAAIASSASKSKRDRDRDPDREARDYPDNRYPDSRDSRSSSGGIRSEDAAIDACAVAAEARGGETSSVRDITDVRKSIDGWDIEGVIEQRDNWRDKSADKKRFSCAVRDGAVEHVYIDSSPLAYNN
jgi:hypothetical protein